MYIYIYVYIFVWVYICMNICISLTPAVIFFLCFAVFVSVRMAAYPFTSIESPSARYFPFDVCLEMAAVASAVNYRVADSKRLALQPHRFRFDIDHCASIGSFSRFVFLHGRICNNRNEITPSLLTRKKIDKIGSARMLY